MERSFADPPRRNRGYLGPDSEALSPQDRQSRRQLRYQLDLNSFNWRIYVINASGFLTDSYNLFSTNVILATISFVYFPVPNEALPHGLIINIATLVGSVIGQLLFGFLADFYGRTRLYGIELVFVIVSTIGVATSSKWYGREDAFLGLFAWWRFVMGIGIGAEYPLSSVITSEWSSTQSRVTMLSSVFLMQPIGQALAQLVGLWVVIGTNNQYGLDSNQCGLNGDSNVNDKCRDAVDGIWRIVIGSGAAPALLAIIFRFFLYDCGLFTLEVKNKPGAAFRDTQKIYGNPPPSEWPGPPHTNGVAMNSVQSPGVRRNTLPAGGMGMARMEQPMPVQFSKEDLWNFLIRDGNWLYLLGTSATWFFLDVSFYGFSLDNRGTLSSLWADQAPVSVNSSLVCDIPNSDGSSRPLVPTWLKNHNTTLPTWSTDATHPCNNIYQVLIDQSKQYLYTVSLASIAGSVCFIALGNRFHRRRFLTVSFFVLALLFVITGAVWFGVRESGSSRATVVMVAVCHFAFNFGANTLTFIIPAEIFPTAYRCTCHGISAAAGKLGSILAVLVVFIFNKFYKSEYRQGVLFILFASFMLFGALCSWAYLPDVQRTVYEDIGDGRERRRRMEVMNLEELGEGREKARREGQVITIRDKIGEIKRRRRGRREHREEEEEA